MHIHGDLAGGMRDLRKQDVDLSPGHQFDEFAVRHAVGIERLDEAPVAQDRNPIRERADLAHAMRHIDDADALALELGDELEETPGLPLGQRRRRLVKDKELHVAEQSLGDFGHLLVGARQVVDALAGSRLKPSSSISLRAARRIRPAFKTPPADISRPRNRLSSTVRLGTSENS